MPVPMPMPMAKCMSMLLIHPRSRTIRPKRRIRPHSILARAHWPDPGTDSTSLLHRAALISQALPASAAHEAVSSQVRNFERRHLPRDLPEVGDGED